MSQVSDIVNVKPCHVVGHLPNKAYVTDQILYILDKILPDVCKENGFDPFVIDEHLPLVAYSPIEEAPSFASIYLLCHYRLDAGKFFYEMVSRYLLPARRTNIDLFFATDFKFYELEKEVYTIGEAIVRIASDKERQFIENGSIPFRRELCLGLSSMYHASRILEIKGVSIDEKTVMIQEKISYLLQRFSSTLDYDIFSLMQQFIITTSRSFKEMRRFRHLTKIICTLYVLVRMAKEEIGNKGQKRFLRFKSSRVSIGTPFGEKTVMGLFVCVNFLKKHEVFEKSHLLTTIQRYVKNVRVVEDSYFVYQPKGEKIISFYLEVEKVGEDAFRFDEIQVIKKKLGIHLRNCIEQLVRPVFMPRNEEEVMKYIVTLSKQVKYIRDLPQVVISFQGQYDQEMAFTIVIVRPLHSSIKPIDALLGNYRGDIQFEVDKVKKIGFVRRKYPKEAIVLRARVQELGYLRDDHSLNLYKARQKVVVELQRLLGEIRDYNGGMLAKQMEAFASLKNALKDEGFFVTDFLEDFFHSLYPSELRGIFPLSALVKLYALFHQELFREEMPSENLQVEEEDHNVFLLLSTQSAKLKGEVMRRVEEFKLPPSHLIQLNLSHEGKSYLGYAFLSSSTMERKVFVKAIQEVMERVR